MRQVCFFFGAGAEYGNKSFDLPSGSEYTVTTMRQKSDNLYSALKKFYNNRLSEAYVDEYRDAFLFKRDSHTFNEIIFRAAKRIIINDEKIADYSDFEAIIRAAKVIIENGETDSKRNSQAWSNFKNLTGNAYELLIKDHNAKKKGATKNANYFEDYLEFYGAVEKDFSSIIDPKRIGLTQFWRVINYYWSAYFAILRPASKQFSWYSEDNDYFAYVLNHLSDIVKDIWFKFDYELYDLKSGNYYNEAKKYFSECNAITTNYTPFVEHYFGNNSIYLAGRLSEFEYPSRLCVKDLRHETNPDNEFMFPFIMTQAPIKPLIVSNQVREYNKMLEALNLNKFGDNNSSAFDETILVIIGYSIGDADNHINSILREFVCNPRNRILYCKLKRDEKTNEKRVQEDIYKRLRLGIENTESHNVDVLLHNGNARELMQRIKNYIDGEALTHV